MRPATSQARSTDLINPPVGTYDFSFGFNISARYSSGLVTLYNVDLDDPISDTLCRVTTGDNVPDAFDVSAGDLALDLDQQDDGHSSLSPNQGQTQLWNIRIGPSNGWKSRSIHSYKRATDTSISLGYFSQFKNSLIVVVFNALLGPPTPTPSISATPTPTMSQTPTAAPGWELAVYTYSTSHPHAVELVDRAAGEDEFGYDAMGNMTTRDEGGSAWIQPFTADGRMAAIVNQGTSDSWDFMYNGDGTRIGQENPDGTTTLFIAGGSYEVTLDSQGNETSIRKYYAIGGQRVMREDDSNYYLLTDHLGSVVGVADGSGTLISDQRYMPYGLPRLEPGIDETDFGFTGQRSLTLTGVSDYQARWYSGNLGKFFSPDLVDTASNYSYGVGNPTRFIDPSGHWTCDSEKSEDCEVGPGNGHGDAPPPFPYLNIPGPQNDGSDDDPVTAITDMLMGEGGSSNLQMAADVLMILFNRMRYAWTCNGRVCVNPALRAINPGRIPWEQITPDQFVRLAVFIAAQDGSKGVPAFNAWGHTQERTPGWEATKNAVANFLAYGNGASTSDVPIAIGGSVQVFTPRDRLRQDVKYYYSWDHDPGIPLFDASDPQANGYVEQDQGGGRWQEYFFNPRTYDPLEGMR